MYNMYVYEREIKREIERKRDIRKEDLPINAREIS